MKPKVVWATRLMKSIFSIMANIKFRYALHCLLVVFILGMPKCVQSQERSACDSANAQVELQQCAGRAYKKADAELNLVYAKLLKKYEHNPKVTSAIKTSQRAWLRFRQLQIAASYPDDENSGSAQEMCKIDDLTVMTNQRVEQLKTMLNGSPDLCGMPDH